MTVAQPHSSTVTGNPGLPLSLPSLRVYLQHLGQQSLPVADLIMLKAEANYSWLIWADGTQMLMPRTLKYYEARLPTGSFVRLHRNYTVNMAHISSVERAPNGVLIHISNGTQLTVARRRWTKIRLQLCQKGIW